MDADFSHPPALVPKMYAGFKATNADVLVASRYIPGGSTPDWPFKRKLLSRAACLLARPLSPIRDAASGFFLIRREIARRSTSKPAASRSVWSWWCAAGRRSLVETAVQFDDREAGESKMSTREAAGYLVQLKDLYLLRWSSLGRPRRVYRSGA